MMSVRTRWLRRLLSSFALATAIAPQAIGCAEHRGIPYSEVSLADMSRNVDVAVQPSGSGEAMVFSGALWPAGVASTQDDDPPPLRDCPSLPRDATATVDGRSARLDRGGWVESTSGGCDNPTTHHFECRAPAVALGALAEAKTTIVVTEGHRAWTIEIGDLPARTTGTFRTHQPMRAGERAEVTLTPVPPTTTTLQARLDAYRCGTLASAELRLTKTSGGFAFTVPQLAASYLTACRDASSAIDEGSFDASDGAVPDGAADPGVRDAAGADADTTDAALDARDADADADADAAHDASPEQAPNRAAVVVTLGFSPRVVTCDGPRSCSADVPDAFEHLEITGTYDE